MSVYYKDSNNNDIGGIIKLYSATNVDPTTTSTQLSITSYYTNFPIGYSSGTYRLKKLNASNNNNKLGFAYGGVDVADTFSAYYEDYTNTDSVNIDLTSRRKFTKAAFVLIGGGGKGGAGFNRGKLSGGDGGGGGGASGSVIITKPIDITTYTSLRIKAGIGGTTDTGGLGGAVEFWESSTKKMYILAWGGESGTSATSNTDGIGGTSIGLYVEYNGVIYQTWNDTLNNIIHWYQPGNIGNNGSSTAGGQGRSIPTGYSAYTPELPSAVGSGNGISGSGYGVGGNGGYSSNSIVGGNGTNGFARVYYYTR